MKTLIQLLRTSSASSQIKRTQKLSMNERSRVHLPALKRLTMLRTGLLFISIFVMNILNAQQLSKRVEFNSIAQEG